MIQSGDSWTTNVTRLHNMSDVSPNRTKGRGLQVIKSFEGMLKWHKKQADKRLLKFGGLMEKRPSYLASRDAVDFAT